MTREHLITPAYVVMATVGIMYAPYWWARLLLAGSMGVVFTVCAWVRMEQGRTSDEKAYWHECWCGKQWES